MNKKKLDLLILIFSIFSIIITYVTFISISVFIDENNLTPSKLLGNDSKVYLEWLKLIFITIIAMLSLTNILRKNNIDQ